MCSLCRGFPLQLDSIEFDDCMRSVDHNKNQSIPGSDHNLRLDLLRRIVKAANDDTQMVVEVSEPMIDDDVHQDGVTFVYKVDTQVNEY